jgi:outer membrane protein assembly factor BamB
VILEGTIVFVAKGTALAVAIVACIAATLGAPASAAPAPAGWGQYGAGPTHAGVAPAASAPAAMAVPHLHAVWSVPVSGGSDGSGPEPSPVEVGGVVYAGSPGGTLYARDASTGAARWTVQLHPGAPLSTPAVSDGMVYVGVGAPVDRIEAFSAAQGQKLWSRHTDASGWVDAPTVWGGEVFVATGAPGQAQPGSEYAFAAAGGRLLWHHAIATTGGALSPAVSHGVAYAATSGDFGSLPQLQPGRLVAFDALTGRVRWSRTPASGVYESPSVSGGVVYVGGVSAVDAFTLAGNRLWSRAFPAQPGGLFTTPTVSDGRVFVGFQEGPCFCALSAATGRVLWRDPSAQGDQFSPASVAGGVVYGVDEDTLEALDARTGRVLFAGPDPTAGQPAIGAGMVFTEGAALTAWSP